jgi:hypothetical protein
LESVVAETLVIGEPDWEPKPTEFLNERRRLLDRTSLSRIWRKRVHQILSQLQVFEICEIEAF